jgi:hypothetical protein
MQYGRSDKTRNPPMPRPRTDATYVEQIATLAAEGHKPPAIFRAVQEAAERAGRDDYPSERTIRRIYEARKLEPMQTQREAALFRWPQSMEEGALPWEASRAALDLLRHMDERGFGRPTVRLVKWYWRVVMAAPQIKTEDAYAGAAFLSTREFAAAQQGDTALGTEAGEWLLAYEPWRSRTHRLAYEQWKRRGKKSYEQVTPWILDRVSDEVRDHFTELSFGPDEARERRERRSQIAALKARYGDAETR